MREQGILRCMAAVFVIASSIKLIADDKPPVKPDDSPAASKSAEMAARYVTVPDPSFVAASGVRALILFDRTPATKDMNGFRQILKVYASRDQVGFAEAVEKKSVFGVAKGTPVIILSVFRPERVVAPPQIMSREAYSSDLMLGGFVPLDTTLYPLEVRFLEGELQGKVMLVPETCVGWLAITGKVKGSPKPAPPPKPIDPVARATALMTMAGNLEKTKKTKGAIETYERIVKDFPDTPQAKIAAERIKAISGKEKQPPK